MQHLLWPNGSPSSASPATWAADLDLAVLVRGLEWDSRQTRLIQDLLTALTTDLATIHHRQAMLADVRANPTFRAALEAQLPPLGLLASAGQELLWAEESPLLAAARRLGELELYVGTISSLRQALRVAQVRATGWRTLQQELDDLAADPIFMRLAADLPGLKRPLEQLSSVTIGINLDSDLRPTSATLLSINDFSFSGRHDLLSRLLGKGQGDGLTPLRPANAHSSDSSLTIQLLRDLESLVGDVGRTLASGLARFSRLQGSVLAPLRESFAFFLGAARLTERLDRAGLPLATAEWLPDEARTTEIEGLYDVTLALQLLDQGVSTTSLVLNDTAFSVDGRVALLTGPNRGGKTTFTRALGLLHVMAQAGLPVPARRARLSPVDAIFTQFASGESHTMGFGRFDEEARRLALLFEQATPSSLILLNEPLSGTNQDEALLLARGVVHALQHLGARALLVTHLHALAREATTFTNACPTAPVISLVASPTTHTDEQSADGVARTFTIRPGPPTGESRALEIARLHGLSPDQLVARLQERGLLSPVPQNPSQNTHNPV